ncbi:MAG: ATP-binding protein [Candidatus Marinimicrobia bacterium]|nr:ATP-binding protein [Candidatus Neomarinimicrobiota bacterium]
MSKLYANPFIWGEPVSSTHYNPRPEEQSLILAAIEQQTPLVITGNRGSGKTSLLRQVIEKSPIPSIYFDLSFVVNREGLINLLLAGIEKSYPQAKTDGSVAALHTQGGKTTLDAVFELWYELVKNNDKKFVIVWDEFQHLAKQKENIVEELRVCMKDRRSIAHIFISPREDVLNEIFSDPNKPFFVKIEKLRVGNLNLQSTSRYLSQRFRRMGLSDFDLPEAIWNFTEGQAQLTQRLAYCLAQIWLEGTTSRLLERSIGKLLIQENVLYTAQWDNFGLNEKRLLMGLASGYSRPTELGFISMFGLSATSTAHNTVLKLLREGWLVNRDEGYHIYNPIFLKWLQASRGLS